MRAPCKLWSATKYACLVRIYYYYFSLDVGWGKSRSWAVQLFKVQLLCWLKHQVQVKDRLLVTVCSFTWLPGRSLFTVRSDSSRLSCTGEEGAGRDGLWSQWVQIWKKKLCWSLIGKVESYSKGSKNSLETWAQFFTKTAEEGRKEWKGLFQFLHACYLQKQVSHNFLCFQKSNELPACFTYGLAGSVSKHDVAYWLFSCSPREMLLSWSEYQWRKQNERKVADGYPEVIRELEVKLWLSSLCLDPQVADLVVRPSSTIDQTRAMDQGYPKCPASNEDYRGLRSCRHLHRGVWKNEGETNLQSVLLCQDCSGPCLASSPHTSFSAPRLNSQAWKRLSCCPKTSPEHSTPQYTYSTSKPKAVWGLLHRTHGPGRNCYVWKSWISWTM